MGEWGSGGVADGCHSGACRMIRPSGLWVLATPVDGTLVELVLKSNPQLLYNLTTPKPLEEVKDGHDPDVIPKGRPIAKVDAVTSRFTLAKGIPDPM